MRQLVAWRRSVADPRRLVPFGLGALLALMAWMVQVLGVFAPLDRKLLDLYFVMRGEQQLSSSVVIVAIDYESLQRAGHPWPWPRGMHARLVRELAAAGASVIVFDVLFLDGDPAQNAELARAAEASGNVVWASTFVSADQERFQLNRHDAPAQDLQVPSAAFGYADLPFDPDGYVRRVFPFRHFGGQIFKSLGVVVAERHRRDPLLYLSASGTRWLGPGGGSVPVERDGSLLINFVGPPASFPSLPYVRVIEGRVPPATFKGKIVVVGPTAEAADTFFTPFYSRLLPETSRLMAGVEIHANIVDMILAGRFLARVGWVWNLLLFLLVGAVASLLANRRHPWMSVGMLAAAVVACLGVGYLLFTGFNLWVLMVGPAVSLPLVWGAVAFSGLVAERKEKDFVRSTLERYVSPAVVEEVMNRRVNLALGGKRHTLTILFSDILGFTGLSERIAPETMVEVLNQHFTEAAAVVLKHQGTLDKFIGDAIMAFWGAPAPRDDHALSAVRAALEIQASAKALDARLHARLGEHFRIGIGINTGDAIVGHIGSPQRMGYTAIGDPVNLASRVEEIAREHQAEILITHFTYELVKFYVEAEPLGFVPVRGRKDPIAIYRVDGLKAAGSL